MSKITIIIEDSPEGPKFSSSVEPEIAPETEATPALLIGSSVIASILDKYSPENKGEECHGCGGCDCKTKDTTDILPGLEPFVGGPN